MRFPRPARSLAAALALVAAACSDSPTSPTTSLALDEVFEQMSLSALAPAGSGIAAAGMPLPGLSPVPSACSYIASVQSFVCAPVTTNGVTITRGYTLFSASGTPQSAFDPSATASVRTTTGVVGRMTVQTAVTDLDAQQTMTLSGLLTSRHVLDGLQVTKMTMTSPEFGTVRLNATTTFAGLVMPERGGRYPKSGSVSTAITSDMAGMGAFTMTMTFNGTSKVDVTISSGGRTERCTIDLAATGPAGSTCFGG